MKLITQEVIDQTLTEMYSYGFDRVADLIDDMTQDQPMLLSYLMASGRGLDTEDHQLMIFLGVTLWLITRRAGVILKPITEQMLQTAERNNIKLLEYLSGEPDDDLFETIKQAWEGFRQPELLTFVIASLMDEDADLEEASMSFENKDQAYMFLCLKTMIDCMDEAGDTE